MVINSCVLFFSLLNGISPDLTNAVIHTESSGNPLALGKFQDSGLMQIRPKFVPETKQQLLSPCTNIMRGTAILADLQSKFYRTMLDRSWVNCYNLGISGCKKLRYPKLFPYYKKVSRAFTLYSTFSKN